MSSQKLNTLVVVADLGTIRAFRTRMTHPDQQHLLEIDVPGQPPVREPIHDQVSDQAGRFPAGTANSEPGGMAHGDIHGKTAEDERRQLKEVAVTVEEVVNQEHFEAWRLAAPKAINNRLTALLSEEIRERLVLNLHADFTKLPIQEIEERLLNIPAPVSS